MSETEQYITEKVKDYQLEAYYKAVNYIKSSSAKHALIHLPTGAGKTGVMALLCAKFKGRILIITPNATLPEQVKGEIEASFWEKIGVVDKPKVNICILNDKGRISDDITIPDTVFIATIQFLQNNSAIKNDELAKLINDNIDCIFFDEGHREPALKWRKFISILKSKIILFSATPYRNDDAVFEIDEEYLYSEEMKIFIEKGDISDVEFIPLRSNDRRCLGLRATVTVSDDELIGIISKRIIDGNKVLIRCETSKDIERLTSFLNEQGVKTLGCHSRLTRSSNMVTEGSKINEISNDYSVFIHCEMMIEGINIPDIKTLIFLDTFSNLRSNAQQIGRALRNTEDSQKAHVYVPSNVIDEFIEQWNYLKGYSYADKKYTYTNGRLKKVLSQTDAISRSKEIKQKDFLIPQKASVYYGQIDIFQDVCRNILFKVETSENCKVIFKDQTERYIFICYQEKTYSPHLNNFACENINTHICILYKSEVSSSNGYYYFYYNSDNSKLFDEEYSDVLTANQVDSFHKLLSKDLEIVQAKYEHSTVRLNGIRGREVIGNNIQDTTATLDQKMSFIRSAKSKEGKDVRYINSITSRISDSNKSTIDDYINWCQRITQTLISQAEESKLFKRFSQVVKPINSIPNFIIADFLGEKIHLAGEEIDVSFTESIGNNKFTLEQNNCNFTYQIKFNAKNNKYSVKFVDSSCENNEDLLVEKERVQISVEELINKSDFRLYFLKEQVVYINGKYYKPNIDTIFSIATDWELYDNIEIMHGLEECLDEKTGKDEDKELKVWHEKSVFGVTYRHIKEKFKDIEYLICDDMQKEIADFIALEAIGNKIIYIHCKHSKKLLSAYEFQEVCGQAMKNIRYIINSDHSVNRFMKKRKEKWSEDWSTSFKIDKKSYKTANISRVKKINEDDATQNEYLSNEAYDKYIEMIADPMVKYEVWLVHSGLSKNKIEKNLTVNSQEEQVHQLIWLLQATNDYLAVAGADLKIFCKK
ncbi:MAG: DEAD/DEAH box helicase family protein [Clostridia bacterium]